MKYLRTPYRSGVISAAATNLRTYPCSEQGTTKGVTSPTRTWLENTMGMGTVIPPKKKSRPASWWSVWPTRQRYTHKAGSRPGMLRVVTVNPQEHYGDSGALLHELAAPGRLRFISLPFGLLESASSHGQDAVGRGKNANNTTSITVTAMVQTSCMEAPVCAGTRKARGGRGGREGHEGERRWRGREQGGRSGKGEREV